MPHPLHGLPLSSQFKDRGRQLLWLAPALVVALWLGWQVQQRLTWLTHGLHIPAQVIELSRSHSRSSTASGRSALRLDVVVDVPDPRREGAVERLHFLAPLLHAVLHLGDSVLVLHDPLTLSPQEPFVLAHPLQLWQGPAFGLLLLGVCWALPYAALHRRYPAPEARRRALRRRQWALGVAVMVPVLVGQALALRDRAAQDGDRALEARWPAWTELDAEVPRPWWWSRLPWHGVDPVTDEAGAQAWRSAPVGPGLVGWGDVGASERRFKFVRARMLALREQPAALAGLLGQGHDPNFIPLYRFFLTHYLDATWSAPGCSRCNDSSQVTEMAGDLMLMLVQDGRLDEAARWAPRIVADKLPGADARARLSFLIAYRSLLEAQLGPEAAQRQLQALVDDAIAAARAHGETWALERWAGFWRGYVARPRRGLAATR